MAEMQTSDLTPRQWWQEIKSRPNRAKFGFGNKAALLHIDLQRAYTDERFATSYQTHPKQLEFTNELSRAARAKSMPVVFSFVAYLDSAADAGVWGTRSNTPDSLQNIKLNSERAGLDARIEFDAACDVLLQKRMPSMFFETHLCSLLVWHQVDTVIVTGGSTSGCVRATVVDALSHGYRTIVVEECVADKHEIPHFANLCDMQLKYADVESFETVHQWLRQR
jgi:nicotinamidase-related amidase